MRKHYLRIIIIVAILGILGSIAIGSANSGMMDEVKDMQTERLMNRGRKYFREDKPDSALVIFSMVADRYSDKLSPKEKETTVLALNNVGIIQAFNYLDYSQAYASLGEAYERAEQDEMNHAMGIICLNIAELLEHYSTCFASDNVREKIDTYSSKGFESAKRVNDYSCMAAIVVNRITHDLSSSTDFCRSLLNGSVPDKDGNVEYARLLIRASDSYKAGDYDAARKYIEQGSTLIPHLNDAGRLWVSHYQILSQILLATNDYPEAEKSAIRGLELADSIKSTDQKVSLLKILSTMDVPDKADYAHRYMELKDSVMSCGRLQLVNELDFLRTLRVEKEKSERLTASRKNLLIWLCVTISAILIIMSLLIIVVRQTRKLKARNKALHQRIVSEAISSRKGAPKATQTSGTIGKYNGSSLTQDRQEELYQKVENIINWTDEPLSPDFSLIRLASMLEVNTSYVSRALNEMGGASFTTLVNARRVKEACARIQTESVYRTMTIEAIGQSVGFSNRGAFITAFKKQNGMTPSEYIRLIKEEAKK